MKVVKPEPPSSDSRRGAGTRSTRSAGVLVSALLFSSVALVVVVSVGALSVSHIGRARTEAAFSAAVYQAETGVNYELDWIAQAPSDPSRAHQAYPASGQPSAYSNIVNGTGFTVAVMSVDGGNWPVGSPLRIRSSGRSKGVVRTIEVLADPVQFGYVGTQGILDFAVFALGKATLSGGSTATGNVGTNSQLQINSANNVAGKIVFAGVSPTVSGTNVVHENQAKTLKTVDQMVTEKFGGWSNLRTGNDNARLKQFNSSGGGYPLSSAVSAGKNSSTWILNDLSNLTKDMNPADKPISQGGTRYCTPSTGLYNSSVLIFPPGDYYFKQIDLSNGAFLIDNAAGVVNIWIEGTLSDKITCPVIMTSTDPRTFRIYYGKAKTLAFSASQERMYGVVYAVNATGQGAVTMSGGNILTGAAFGQNVTVSGGSRVVFPTGGVGGADGNAASYVTKRSWREVGTNGPSVFPDGTSY
ncbi:MAG: hypothetical protein KIS66_14190 [Fimbriimonadaceae bacterium]|nr:hypothetical protein [Fimbriimonadaceae bacterium]